MDAIAGHALELSFENLVQDGVVYVAAYDSASTCESALVKIAIGVNELPIEPIRETERTECAGTSFDMVMYTGGTVLIYADSLQSNPVTSQQGRFLSFENLQQDSLLYVATFDESTGCESDAIKLSITVNALPQEPVEETELVVCEGATVVVPVVSDHKVRRYSGDDTGRRLLTSYEDITELRFENVKNSFENYLTAFNTETGCESEQIRVAVVVNEVPVEPLQETDRAVCAGSTVILPLNDNEAIQVYADEMRTQLLASIDEADELTLTNLQTDSLFYVTAYDPATSCESDVVKVAISVNELPDKPLQEAQLSACEGSDVEIPLERNGPVHLYADSGGSNLIAIQESGDIISLQNLAADSTLYIAALDAGTGCESELVEVSVRVGEVPEAPLPETMLTLCQGASVNLPVEGGFSIRVYDDAMRSNLLYTETGIDELILESIDTDSLLFVTAFNQEFGCESEPVSITIQVDELPEAPLEETTLEVCAGSSVEIPVDGRNTILIYKDALGTELLSSQVGISQLFIADLQRDTLLFVSALEVATGCESLPVAVSILVNDLPEEPTLSFTDGTRLFTDVVAVRYVWYRDGTVVEETDQPFLNISLSGDYRVEIFDELGCSAISEELPVRVLSVNDLAEVGIKLYPNPVRDQMTIEWEGQLANEQLEITLYDMGGRPVRNLSMLSASVQLDMKGLGRGVYMLVIRNKELRYQTKVIKY